MKQGMVERVLADVASSKSTRDEAYAFLQSQYTDENRYRAALYRLQEAVEDWELAKAHGSERQKFDTARKLMSAHMSVWSRARKVKE